MADLDTEIATYNAQRQELEACHMGKWVVARERELIAVYDSFEVAAEDAVRRFGRGPYLIRQVGAGPIRLRASVMYNPVHGQ